VNPFLIISYIFSYKSKRRAEARRFYVGYENTLFSVFFLFSYETKSRNNDCDHDEHRCGNDQTTRTINVALDLRSNILTEASSFQASIFAP
jgi:hypothetical protein